MFFQRSPACVFSASAPVCIFGVCPHMFMQHLPAYVFSAIARSCVSGGGLILMADGFGFFALVCRAAYAFSALCLFVQRCACFFSAALVFSALC